MEMTRRAEKSNFSVTCSLLSQYIKEKGSFADLGIGVPSRLLDSSISGLVLNLSEGNITFLEKPETYRPPTTMNLLPGVDVSGDGHEGTRDDSSSRIATRSMELFPQHAGLSPTSPPAEATEPEKAQLTIFYGGKVLVFDNFPAEKAKDLMRIASKGQNSTCETANIMDSSAPAADLHSFTSPAKPPANFPARAQPNFSDLPIARKESLHRFLQKRKDRISSQAPYKLTSRDDSKDVVNVEEEINQPWLGLGSQILKPGSSSDCRSANFTSFVINQTAEKRL